ncbi:MAG: peptidase T, partial [Streptococcaceae bacterium]|nr:peptidase T [Streptococcaceae bacterium]
MSHSRKGYESLPLRFMDYVTQETRSNPESLTTPSTHSQVAFALNLKAEMEMMGLEDVHYLTSNGYVVATLPSTPGKEDARKIGFIAHVDTADFNAENVNPQIVENYDGESIIPLDSLGKFTLDPAEFPNLRNYKGHDLITTDGSTLLGSDDKSGIAEILTAMEYLLAHPEISHGEIRVAFGPDEEIGVGADKFDVEDFNVDFAYTIDGGPVGELQYETFSAAGADIVIQGKNVHPGTAKNLMVNALQVAIDFHNQLPSDEVPEKTSGYEGFFHLHKMSGTAEEAKLQYIIRDFDKEFFLVRKQQFIEIVEKMNAEFKTERVKLKMKDQYYNMKEIIEKDMSIIDLAEKAMIEVGVKPDISPIRGGTDGSKISFMGIPTPNIFAGGENMHGRFE